MKKTILSIAIMVAAFAGTSAISAQAPANGAPQEQRAPRGQAPKVYNPFENLGLSEQQTADLKALSDAQRANARENRDKGQKPEERAAALEQERKDNLAKIKAILTPEQYIKFLENCYLNPQNQRMNRGMQRQGRPDGMRGQRGGQRGNFGGQMQAQ